MLGSVLLLGSGIFSISLLPVHVGSLAVLKAYTMLHTKGTLRDKKERKTRQNRTEAAVNDMGGSAEPPRHLHKSPSAMAST